MEEIEETKKNLVNEIYNLRKQLEELEQGSEPLNSEVVNINKIEFDEEEEGTKIMFKNTYSKFKKNYACEILSLKLTSEEIVVEFNQWKVNSSEKCQEPYLSKLYLEYNDFKEKLALLSTDLICEDENNGFSGRIFYERPRKNGEITFIYGTEGYDKVSLGFYIDKKLVKCV